MKRGKTERETLDLNGWGLGDILEGDEGFGPDQIKITAVGEERFLCRWKYRNSEEWGPESGNTSLTCREWVHKPVRTFRAGDHVKHAPTGEEWELACDEERGEVMPSGWPMGIAKAKDCTLISDASDEWRMLTLRDWAREGRGYEAERDLRTLTARRQLSSANAEATRTGPEGEAATKTNNEIT